MRASDKGRNLSASRVKLAKEALLKSKIDALIFFDGDRCGRKFASTAAFTALVMFPERDPVLIAHSIEKDHAESESKLETIELRDTTKLKNLLKRLLPKTTNERTKTVAVVPWNAKFEKVSALQEMKCKIVDAGDKILSRCLNRPFPEEIQAIRKLSSICDDGLKAAHEVVRSGLREYEVGAEVNCAVEKLGVTEFAFPTIVASGYRAAFPHGWTSSKKIDHGDSVVVDIGPILDNYDGCVCRTFIAGDRKNWKREVEIVLEAIYDSLNILKDQKTTKAAHIDRVARETVKKHGYSTWPNMKTVWTGHPIGGFWSPIIAPHSKDRIEEGMVFTVEPGIYVKGKGGVRVEHHVLAKRYDYEILDKFTETP